MVFRPGDGDSSMLMLGSFSFISNNNNKLVSAQIIHYLIMRSMAMMSSIVRSTIVLILASYCGADSRHSPNNFIGDDTVGPSAFCVVSSITL